jgi:hypothetical protein
MVHHDWRDAARALRQSLEPFDAEQRELAELLGVSLPDATPARVAAALIGRHLAGPLRFGPDRPVSPAQQEFLDDLLAELDISEPVGCKYSIRWPREGAERSPERRLTNV